MAARVVIDQAGMNALFRDVSGPVAADLLRRVIQVEAAAKRLCPVDTGTPNR
jgi:hypothetical protein